MSAGLDRAERDLYARLADILIPEAEGMPAASAVGIGDALLDQALNYRPDLRAPLLQALRSASGCEPADAVARLMAEDAEGFRALSLLAAGGYYLSAEVRALIGYPGQERRPFDPAATPEYVTNGLLDRVVARGPIWRPA